ncbi:MAG: bifunctional diaminohydroxyphosphoribosylaminopyrimidine deaminase/5-amino-6-(5-phosphoribosylamino)uracil reductase RibD [Alphaproteobacteria bacterium]|nr:bifunctional diaminohydroxyphosphoribosylaminopyrimidine deaminase/5-amino-6-(5-phosphoribosylamino)uracil reductase RibD [Alphaproteobacteria bacterium]MCB9699715.1 bifunctional diaminohydroxyphosphoribosylaminopyrimidine deaminase/5-amino-6-(5-phosphoribosylamino)uracil reductase RibD [Alphaproteobacteria bacterium]
MSNDAGLDRVRWMRRALELSQRALGNTAPNPPVGAVLVRDGQLLGEGWTQPAGSDHAEVMAIAAARAAGHDPKGATMVVTLEPCCHQGRTAPCTTAILDAGIARVVVGIVDPFPPMRGKGLEALRGKGVDVVLGVEAEACSRSMRGFLKSVNEGVPEITAKVASSLDGRIATAAGESKWITSEDARDQGHRLRAANDAILVGIGTVLADDPALTCRLPDVDRSPVPVILDSQLRIPDTAKVLQGPRRAQIFCVPSAPRREIPNADVWRVMPGPDRRPDVVAVARQLARIGLHRVLVEGGGTVLRSFVDAKLVDTLEVFVAPMAVPGGIPWLGGAAIEHLADAVRAELREVGRVGPDAHLTLDLRYGDD